jgi:23S rRNA pseudouridine1911/1915/1917 synthase
MVDGDRWQVAAAFHHPPTTIHQPPFGMAARTFIVGRSEAGRAVADWLRARLAVSWGEVHRLLRGRRVFAGGAPCLDPTRRVRRGERFEVRPPDGPPRGKAKRPPPVRPPESFTLIQIRYADEHVVVVDKPPGLTTMRHADETAEFGPRGKRFLPPTLADLLPGLLARGKPGKPPAVRAVHRLDKETSGLVVFARTAVAESALGKQFRAHSTERAYWALVRGRAREGRVESWLVRDRGDGRRGSSTAPGGGQRAVTHVRVVEELGDFTLVECRLETGRTHQVRIHLGEAGTPLCGERVYDRPPHGRPAPDGSGAPRVALHAAALGFAHPATGARMRWEAPPPPDLDELLKRLRRRARAPGT